MTTLAPTHPRITMRPGAYPLKSLRAKRFSEGIIRSLLFGCGLFSVFTTFAIIFVLFEEGRKFFTFPQVSFWEFITGLEWAPLLGATRHFGIWPLVVGTLWITFIAACIALPGGLITAIYLSEYAPRRVRTVIKPVLEVLAGIPTVVYGFFALSIITPGIQWLIPGVGTYNALGAGIAVGIMALPIVCSLSEDALQAVPRNLREAAYGLGATKFDVSIKVVLPAALSGVVAAFLLSIARAIGETMIVALAAGGAAVLSADPRDEMQTITAYMVQIFLGDTAALGVEYYSSYAVACVLFIMTFIITVVGHFVKVRFREAYQ